MRTQKCGGCGAVLDVSSLEKGSKFACSNCATVLTVGEAVAARKSFQESGPAFQPRAAKEKEAPKAPRRPARAEAGRGERVAAKKSPMPLLLGAGALVVSGVVLAIVLGGDRKGAGGPGGPTAPGVAAAKKLSPQEWWAQATTNLDGTPRRRDASSIRAILRDAKAGGYDKDPVFWKAKEDELYAELIAKAPDDPEANRRAGRRAFPGDYPDFAKKFERIQGAFPELSPEWQTFVKDLEDSLAATKVAWFDGTAFDERKANLDAILAWLDAAESDPYKPAIQKGINLVRADPILKRYDAHPMVVPPFIVFVSYPKAPENATPEARAEHRKKHLGEAQERAKELEMLYRAYVSEFEEKYRKPLGLPEFKPTDILYQFVFHSREAFNEYNSRAEGQDVNPNVLGYFNPKNRWVFLDMRDADEEGGISNLNTMAHETTHQMQWFFSKDPKDRMRNYFDELHAVWFTEGWAEYVGGSCRIHPETKKPEFSWYSLGRVDTLRWMKKEGIPAVPIRDLIDRENYGEFLQWVQTWLPGMRDSVPESAHKFLVPQNYLPVLYAQGWLFVHYLNRFGNGKYREPFLDFVGMSFRGRYKPAKYLKDPTQPERWRDVKAAFEEIFQVKSEADWERIQKEYDQVREQVIREAPELPKKKDEGSEEEK